MLVHHRDTEFLLHITMHMPYPFTPTYTPGIAGCRPLPAHLGRLPVCSNPAHPSASLPDTVSRPVNRSSSAFRLTYATYTGLCRGYLCADQLPRRPNIHLPLLQLKPGSYPPRIRTFSPTQVQNPAGWYAFSPTWEKYSLSLTHSRSLTGIHNPQPAATHALTPLLKGVRARGEKSDD